MGEDLFFLECEDKIKLREFYEDNGLVCFRKRNLEKDERNKKLYSKKIVLTKQNDFFTILFNFSIS